MKVHNFQLRKGKFLGILSLKLKTIVENYHFKVKMCSLSVYKFFLYLVYNHC